MAKATFLSSMVTHLVSARLSCWLTLLTVLSLWVVPIWGQSQDQKLVFNPGMVTTFAGGGPDSNKSVTFVGAAVGPNGVSFLPVTPFALAVDADGNVYIARRTSNVVQVVAASTKPIPALPAFPNPTPGNIYPLAGNGSVPSTTPPSCLGSTDNAGDGCNATDAPVGLNPNFGSGRGVGIAVDSRGNVYISDPGARLVRVVYAGGSIPNVPSDAVPGNIYKIAGTVLSSGSSGDIGPALSAQLNVPTGLRVDGNGNIYIADETNHSVRVVYSTGAVPNVSGGIRGNIYRIAGSAIPGEICGNPKATPACGDGGPATSAVFGLIADVALDSAGNVYISDTSNFRLRVVYVSGSIPGIGNPGPGNVGNVFTIAGNGTKGKGADEVTAAASELSTIAQLAPDPVGNIYVVDTDAGVRKIDPFGIITTVFRSGAQPCRLENPPDGISVGEGCPANLAKVVNPTAVALDSAGNLFVGDKDDRRIRKVGKLDIFSSALYFSGIVGAKSPPQEIIVSNAGASPTGLGDIVVIPPFNLATGEIGDCDPATALASGASCKIRFTYSAPDVSATSSSAVLTAGGQSVSLIGRPSSKNSTTTQLSISPAVVSEGQPVTFAATVKTTFATKVDIGGTVRFKRGTIPISEADVPLVPQPGGFSIATLLATLPVGNYSGANAITASYSGDLNYVNSDSSPGTLNVVPASTPIATVSLSASSATPSQGQDLTLTATLTSSGSTPTGTVAFMEGPNALGTATLNGGTATFATNNFLPGPHILIASYNGDSAYSANVSPAVRITVGTAQLMFAPGIISTVAGTPNNPGNIGDGGPATQAKLSKPQAVFVDAAGNLYIADANNRRVRKVGVDQKITNVAGKGTSCPPLPSRCGDDGIATDATLTSGPNGTIPGLWADAYGHLYIADSDNYSVRMVDLTKSPATITTVAGTRMPGQTGDDGPAKAAKLASIGGIAGDNAGNLYIVSNNRIRKVDGQSGIIRSVAGGGPFDADGVPATSAVLAPQAVSVDSVGNIYIVDSNKNRVRKVDAQTGLISTVAGGGTSTEEGMPATKAKLSSPTGVVVDPAGNLYIVDRDSNAIRMVNGSGIITTLAGKTPLSAVGGFGGDGGPATDALLYKPQSLALDLRGNLYIADPGNPPPSTTGNNVIREVVVDGSPTTAVNTPLRFGDQQACHDAGKTISVFSTGNNPLTLSNLELPAGFTLTQGLGDCSTNLNLPAGASCNLGVLFSPTQAKDYSGPLSITDNSNNATSGKNIIALQGAGVGTCPQQDQTISFPLLQNISYGAAPIALGASASSGLPVTYSITSGPATVSGSVLTIKGAGMVSVKASQSGNATYKKADDVTQSFTVAPAVLTVAALDDSRSQGADNRPFAFTITGFKYTDTQASAVTGTPAITTTATKDSPPGTYPITAARGTLAAANYTFAFVNGTLTVTGQQFQSITFPPFSNVTYGSVTAISLEATASSGLPVTYTVNTPATATVSGSTLTIKGAGPVTVTANQAGNATYAPASLARTFSVLKAPLTVAADEKVRAAGQENPALTYAFIGFVNGDAQPSAVTGMPVLDTPAKKESPVGTYPITVAQGTLAAANYSFILKPGTLTVSPAAVVPSSTTLTVSPSSVTVGDSVTFTATVTGMGGAPAGTVKFREGTTLLGTSTLVQGVAVFSTALLSQNGTDATRHWVAAEYGGDLTFVPSTSSAISVTVTPVPPDFTLTASPSEITIPSGSTRVVMISMTPIHGFKGSVTLTCGQLPANVSCVFTPATLTTTGQTAAQSTLTVFTNGTSAALVSPGSFAPGASLMATALFASFWMTGLVFVPNRQVAGKKKGAGKKSKLCLPLLVALTLAAAMTGLAACGGASTTTSPVTAAQGTHTVTVTAAASAGGNITHTLNLKITVQ